MIRETKAQLFQEVAEYKATNPCSDCGQRFHFVAMQFDHRPGELKIGEVSNLIKAGARLKVWAEIAKCDLVCANCHAIRTYQRQQAAKNITPV
jgi:molybdopterin synthase catalytic subunit